MRDSQTSWGFQLHGTLADGRPAVVVRSARTASAVALNASVQLIGAPPALAASPAAASAAPRDTWIIQQTLSPEDCNSVSVWRQLAGRVAEQAGHGRGAVALGAERRVTTPHFSRSGSGSGVRLPLTTRTPERNTSSIEDWSPLGSGIDGFGGGRVESAHAPTLGLSTRGPSASLRRSASVPALTAGASCRRRQRRQSIGPSRHPLRRGDHQQEENPAIRPARASCRRRPAGTDARGSISLYAEQAWRNSSACTYAAGTRRRCKTYMARLQR
jgi:hypothetical protein